MWCDPVGRCIDDNDEGFEPDILDEPSARNGGWGHRVRQVGARRVTAQSLGVAVGWFRRQLVRSGRRSVVTRR